MRDENPNAEQDAYCAAKVAAPTLDDLAAELRSARREMERAQQETHVLTRLLSQAADREMHVAGTVDRLDEEFRSASVVASTP